MPEREQPAKLGRYDIVREIGRGAMGVVYEGRDAVIGRRVAIKTARRDVMEGSGRADELMQRFLREARAAGVISHPNVITIYDAGCEGELAYIAMEYVESGTLRDLIGTRKSLSPQEVVGIGAGICNGLAAAHACGIVHRDIKPANIMVLPDGSVKVADFGIAHVIDSNLTMEGCMIGTPSFMSPEQFGGRKIDHRSDLFSVGVILYELLTGERPFAGDGICATMHQVLKTNPAFPSELNVAITPALSQVVMKALRKEPGERYAGAAAMAAALQESLKPVPDPAILQTDLPPLDATVKMQSDVPTVPSRRADAPGPLPAAPSALSAPPREHKRNWVAAIAALISLIVLVATSYFLMVAPDKPAPDKPAPVSADTAAMTGNAGQAATFSVIEPMIWMADSAEAYQTARDESVDIHARFVGCRAGTAAITVTDAVTNELLATAMRGDESITLRKESPNILLTASAEGYENCTTILEAKRPGEVRAVDVVLKKSGLP